MSMHTRVLLVRQGVPPSVSVATLPQASPEEGEVLVQVQAAALTPTDILLCSELQPPLGELFPATGAPRSFVPGFFFGGEVVEIGAFVEGLEVGEHVLGALSGDHFSCTGSSHTPKVDGAVQNGENDVGDCVADRGSLHGGCYRELLCVHFSALVPASELLATGFHLHSIVAHIPLMVDALFSVTSHLRLRAEESLLVVAPRLMDAAFLLQRLLLISDAWSGPLYLVVMQGQTPGRAELERHPLLRPLLPYTPLGVQSGGGTGEPWATFLDNFVGISAEDHMQQQQRQQFGRTPNPAQLAEALRELVGGVVRDRTGGAGLDVVLALDVDLAPPAPEGGPEIEAPPAAPDREPAPRPPTMLRTLLGALALRGRLVTNCPRVEMMPADSEHLWAKEGTLSMLNPHCLLLSAARRGALLHAMTEVAGRILSSELPVAESEVVQFRLFEQFRLALESSAGAAGGPGRSLLAGGGGAAAARAAAAGAAGFQLGVLVVT